LGSLVVFVLLVQGCSTTPGTGLADLKNRTSVTERTAANWRIIQGRLNKLGYNAGPVDGKPGPQTANAISQFQRSIGVPATGVLSSKTETVLLAGKSLRKTNVASKNTSTTNRSTGNTETDEALLTPANLSGRWVPTQLYLDDKVFNRVPTIKRNLLKTIYDFKRTGEGRYLATKSWRNGDGHPGTAELVIRKRRDNFSLQLSSNRASLRESFPAYSIEPKRSFHGVDIMTNVSSSTSRQSLYFIRYRDTPAAREVGVSQYDYAQFCSGPARKLAVAARAELDALKKLADAHPRVGSKYSSRNATSLGLFGSGTFNEVVGKPFTSLSERGRSTLIERLRVCAIYHQDRGTADTIAAALFGKYFTHEAVKKDVGRAHRGNKAFESRTTSRSIEGSLRDAKVARKSLAAARESLEVAGLKGDARLEARKQMFEEHAFMLPPSEVATEFAELADALKGLASRQAAAQEAELDRTQPAAPETRLIAEAARKYLLADCRRAALALRDDTGKSYISLALARSVEPRNGKCVIDSATHLFSFNISQVSQQQCTSGDPAECRFLAHWSCSYNLNKSFGFSPDTVNIDPICPLVRSAPVRMEGVFVRKAPRRWLAQRINW